MRFLAEIDGKEVGEPWWEAGTLADLADISLVRGDLQQALEFAERSRASREATGQSPMRSLATLGDIAMRMGDLDRAESLLTEAATGWERSGHDTNYASTIGTLAEIERRRGNSRRAEELLREAIRRLAALDDRPVLAECLRLLALAAADRGFAERAGVLWGAADALYDSGGISREPDYDEEPPNVPEAAREAGARLSHEEAVEYALASLD
jgi:non-specific serine/threonine protein kinase